MTWPVYALIVVFGLFILILVINPNLSCFGRRIKSPFYPILRKRRPVRRKIDVKARLQQAQGRPEPGAGEQPSGDSRSPEAKDKTDDYGFHLD